MSLIKEIILQLFFALTPFVLFNIYYRDKIRNYSPSFILFTSSVTLLLAMTFSSSAAKGVIFDIRYVIIFFGLVYGGMKIGLILLAEFVLYRLYLGGDGKWVALLILLCCFTLAAVFSHAYRNTQQKSTINLLAGIVFSATPLVMTYSFLQPYFMQDVPYHLIVIPIQNCVGVWLLMTLFGKAVEDKEIFIRHAQNEKLATISHVASSMVHEVRNPLTAVKGFLTLIKEAPQDLPKVEQYITICLDEVKRTEAILSDYLSISKPLSQRQEQVDLSQQLHIVHDVMYPFAIMNNVELEIKEPGVPVMIQANPDEIKQVLVNFIKNAVEACCDVEEGKVTLSLTQEAHSVILEIRDNGIGMSESDINRLGTVYFSTKSSGTGLGLTYSYNAIQVMGGKIGVSSKPRMGTIFTISFPAQT